MEKPNHDRTIDGIAIAELGSAINKVRISRGITKYALAERSGYNIDYVIGGNAGARAAQGVLQAMGLSAAEVMAEASSFVDITRQSVDEAITYVALSKGMERQGFNAAFKKQHPTAQNETGCHVRSETFENDFHRAKFLGCQSIGDMLNQAQAVKERLFSVPDEILVFSVDALQKARFPTVKELLKDAPLKARNYEKYIAQKHFPRHVRTSLPGLFGLESVKAIVEEAQKLEPMPDRVEFGKAVFAHYSQRHAADYYFSFRLCSKAIGGKGEHTFSGILAGEGVAEAHVRQVPALFGLSTMREVIETAKPLSEVQRKAATPRVRQQVEKPAEDNPPASASREEWGFWSHLLNARELAKKYGKEGPSI